MEIEQMQIRMGEMAAEIERLSSAWQVETLNRKDTIIAKQEAENDRLKAENAGMQSPAVAVPDTDVLASIIRKVDGAHSLGASALAERIVEELKASKSSPSITEQDAREILESFCYEYCSIAGIDEWCEKEGRALLNKLNGAKS